MARSASITIRVDEDTKKEAAEIAQDVGLNLSSAITLFLRQIVIRKEIPLTLASGKGKMNWDSPLIVGSDPAHGHVILKNESAQDAEYYDKLYGDVK